MRRRRSELLSWNTIIRHACQTRSFSHIADLDIFQIPQAQASDPRARSNQDEDRSDFLYDPDVDSEDINCVSQMFISDQAGKNCNDQSLGRITRNHDSIQCLSDLPYIVPPLELNVKSRLHATFSMKMPNRSETDRCLQIYASGINDTTFPFLGQHSEFSSHLHGLVSRSTAQNYS